MKTIVSYAWRTVVCAVAYMIGSTMGGVIATGLGVAIPSLPGAEPAQLARNAFLASLIFGLALAPLVQGLRVPFVARVAAIALLAYVCLGVNTALETSIFTSLGGGPGIAVIFLPATLALAAAAAAVFRPAAVEPAAVSWSRFWRQFDAWSWCWRLAAALVAFPAVYLAFGSIVGPFVMESYRSQAHGLLLPTWGQIIPIQFLRSALFLLASVPAIAFWTRTATGSRRPLVLALGLAHFALVGLFGLLQAYWLPNAMRLVHGAEIAVDSFTYAALVVLLLVRAAPVTVDGPAAAVRQAA